MMARPVVLGNNSLTVGLDENGYVHDFYYPYVGLENLTTARSNPHYIGVWVDGKFSWLHENFWQKDINFQDDALIGKSTFLNNELKLKLTIKDFVDCSHNTFARKVTVNNLSDKSREIRIFFHQTFQISADGRGDTAMYVPDGHYILDYKGRCSILAYAEHGTNNSFDQWAVGNTGIEGKEGTYKDAEDGKLSNSVVEHASVDSVMRCSLNIDANREEEVRYWLCVSDSQDKLEAMHRLMLNGGFYKRLRATKQHWWDWLDLSNNHKSVVDKKYLPVINKSLMIIKTHIDKHGGIIASCDSSIYNYGRDYYSYVWPRDGAYAIWPLIKLGYEHEAKKYFEFCNNIITKRGYLMHKYQPDLAIGSTWHPLLHGKNKELAIQEDETASIIIMLGKFLEATGDLDYIKELYNSLISPAANFMAAFIDKSTRLPHASYDLWEEKFLTTTYTASTVYSALITAADIALRLDKNEDNEYWKNQSVLIKNHSSTFYSPDKRAYIKGFILTEKGLQTDNTLDVSSLYGAFMYGYGQESELKNTAEQIENLLLSKSPSGGIPRYEYDKYFTSEPPYMGNPWFVTTLWMSQYYSRMGFKERAVELVDWAVDKSLASGALSEQVDPSNGSIVGVTPLVWSHAELINAILDLEA